VTLRQLELFLALVKTPHLSQVAEENGLTQSAVSMAVKALEETLGKPLFDRINKRLVLNENGRFFYRMVDPLVFGLRESETMFRDQDLIGDIRVGASSSIANYILPQIIYEFVEQYKGVRVENVTGNTIEIGRLIESGEVDIGFVEGEYSSKEVEREILGTDELYVVTGIRGSFAAPPIPWMNCFPSAGYSGRRAQGPGMFSFTTWKSIKSGSTLFWRWATPKL